jgi:hypothetical protein
MIDASEKCNRMLQYIINKFYSSPMTAFLTYANQIKDNERGWKCRTHGDTGNECWKLVGESEGKRPLQRSRLD